MKQTSMSGYRGLALEILEKYGVEPGDYITINSSRSHAGTIMPRYYHSDDLHIVLKLDNGYNVGVPIRTINEMRKVSSAPASNTPDETPPNDASLPDILLVSTGGTISSRIDYRTGAVTPALDGAQLRDSVPELSTISNIHTVELMSEYSENINPQHWLAMAKHIHQNYASYKGIILAHGTDTMQYTASFLSFALAGLPIPVILTGSQRSSDRASSDAALNLMGAATAIAGGIPRGIYVAMHHDENDLAVSLHRGTRVRKTHTSARGAFRTINGRPPYMVSGGSLIANEDNPHDYYHDSAYTPRIGLRQQAHLIKYYPGFDPALLDMMAQNGCRAIIFEGTGLGHVGRGTYDVIRKLQNDDVFLGMASQCVWGRTGMTVYESGRDLLHMGVVPLRDMLSETALIKAMWGLAHGSIHELMTTSIASEVSP